MNNVKLPRNEGGLRVNGRLSGSRPRVSIVTAVLNGAATLERTIQSVLAQSCRGIEYIIVDGGSVDGTVDLLAQYASGIDYWVSEPDHGIYHALNKGIALASGEWVYFLGADDALIDDGIISQLFSREYETQLLYGNVQYGAGGTIYGGEFTKRRLFYENICHQGVFYRRDIFEIMGGFDTRYKLLADWVFNMQAFGTRGVNPVHLDLVVAEYALDGASGRIADERFARDRPALIRKHFGLSHYLLFEGLKFKKLIDTYCKIYLLGLARKLFPIGRAR